MVDLRVTVAWTAYPVAFSSIASTLTVPLFVAAVGIILRGAAYALQSGARAHPSRSGARGRQAVERHRQAAMAEGDGGAGVLVGVALICMDAILRGRAMGTPACLMTGRGRRHR